MSTFVVELIEDGDDVVLPLPQEVIDSLGLKEGDNLNWAVQEDGSVILTKV